MRSRRPLSLLALLAAGCGGGGETRQSNDGAPPVDMAAGGGGTGLGGGGGAIGGAGGTTTGAEIGAACLTAGDCKGGYCFDDICCRSDCSGLCQSCSQPGSVGTCMN